MDKMSRGWDKSPLVRSDKYFVSFSTCNPTACSHWLTQSQKEDDIYYLFIIGWHTIYFTSYWLNILDLSLLHMSSVRWMLVQVENKIFVTSNRAWSILLLTKPFIVIIVVSSKFSPVLVVTMLSFSSFQSVLGFRTNFFLYVHQHRFWLGPHQILFWLTLDHYVAK